MKSADFDNCWSLTRDFLVERLEELGDFCDTYTKVLKGNEQVDDISQFQAIMEQIVSSNKLLANYRDQYKTALTLEKYKQQEKTNA